MQSTLKVGEAQLEIIRQNDIPWNLGHWEHEAGNL